jgi:threonine dehydrogenase-like Zn-dependent dehydrogenase
MRALVIQKPGEALIENIPQPELRPGEKIGMHAEKLYPANLSIKELCIVEPLTVGFHAVGRGRVQPGDIVAIFGCGGVGLGAVAASHFPGALTEDFARVIQMLESGAFPVEQAVGTIVPLDQAPVILKQWSESPQRFTKIMVSLD